MPLNIYRKLKLLIFFLNLPINPVINTRITLVRASLKAHITNRVLNALIALVFVISSGCSKETQATKIKTSLNDRSSNGNDPNQPDGSNNGTSSIVEEGDEGTEADVTASSDATENASQASLNGGEIYAQKCAGCHGNVESSTKRNRSAAAISNSEGITPHQGIEWPDDAEIEAIADALSQ